MTALNDLIVEHTGQVANEPTPAERRRGLVRAAEAIVAEIERMDRAAASDSVRIPEGQEKP